MVLYSNILNTPSIHHAGEAAHTQGHLQGQPTVEGRTPEGAVQGQDRGAEEGGEA